MNMSTFSFRKMSLAIKLPLAVLVVVGLGVAAFVASNAASTSRMVEERTQAAVAEKTRLLIDLIDASDKDLRGRVSSLTEAFRSRLKGTFVLAPTTVEIKGKPAPTLELDGKVLDLDFSVVDDFTATSGAVATVFARAGDDFVRVTTSLKDEKGERVVGTLLDRAHPAYLSSHEGREFTGLARLFGRQYITRYEPVRGAEGKVIGLLFVGLDFTAHLDQLKDTIRRMKIGETGYFYVMDSRPGEAYGTFLVHPTSEGKSMLDTRDADGSEFLREIVDRKEGVIRYPWINAALGETAPRPKIATFAHLKGWEWVVAGGYYEDEATAQVRHQRDAFGLLGAAVVLLVSAALYLLIRRLLILPLGEVMATARGLSQGDMSVELRVDRGDEMGQLAESINKISSGLRAVVLEVRRGSSSVAAASAEISQGNQDLSSRTVSQAAALEETAASMEELSSTIQQNAGSARQVSQLAESTSAVAEKGGAEVARVVGTMKEIHQSSRRIADIIEVMDGIAFQTNILALNASVEAARAGEQGLGFAVVASEVRSLAGRSAAAAKEIAGLIKLSVDRIEKGTALVDQAGSTMTEVVGSIRRVTELVHAISSASDEQASGVSQVTTAVSQMDQNTQQNAALVEEMAAAAGSLETQARALVQTVSVFRIEKASREEEKRRGWTGGLAPVPT